MHKSFKKMKLVPDHLLEERIEWVQTLKEDDTESYDIVKDKMTGEHYLHYYFLQVNLGGLGEKEVYNHFMPVENDDVLVLLFENPDYQYPDAWKDPYLRNGPEGHYVWYDPGYSDDFEHSVRIEMDIHEKLKQFKQQGRLDEESINHLIQELEQLQKDRPGR